MNRYHLTCSCFVCLMCMLCLRVALETDFKWTFVKYLLMFERMFQSFVLSSQVSMQSHILELPKFFPNIYCHFKCGFQWGCWFLFVAIVSKFIWASAFSRESLNLLKIQNLYIVSLKMEMLSDISDIFRHFRDFPTFSDLSGILQHFRHVSTF